MLATASVVSSVLLGLAALTPGLAAPLIGRQQQCADVMVIFARGTTEAPPIGTLVGPPFQEALVSALGGRSLSFQGVNYAADIEGYLEGGDPEGSRQMAVDITNTANACPNAKIVSSGYSQGGQLVHNSAAQLSSNIAARVDAVVIFGDPKSHESVPNIDASKVKVFCHAGDNICDGGVLILPPHLNYNINTPEAAQFVASKISMHEAADIRRTSLCDRCQTEFISTVDYPPIPVHLLRSDAVPTETQSAEILEVIQKEEHELGRYVTELTRLRQAVAKLESEQTLLEKHIKEGKNCISALRRIPEEIWREIFIFSVASTSNSRSAKHLGQYQLLLASHVSSSWRRILISFPRIWSSLDIVLQGATRGAGRIVDLYLQNAGTHPLQIAIHNTLAKSIFDNEDDHTLNHVESSMLHALVLALPRCSELKWSGDLSVIGPIPRGIKRKISLPRLQTCTLIDADGVFAASTTWFRELLSNASQLREISLDADTLYIDNPGIFPYQQLNHLSIRWLSLLDLIRLLASSKNLLSLTWGCCDSDPSSFGFEPLVSNIQVLKCSCTHPSDIEAFFKTVLLPSLTTLYINPFDPDEPNVRQWGGEPSVLALLERSRASLQKLTIHCGTNWYLSLVGLESILRSTACSSLTFLELSVRHDDPSTPNGFVLNFMSYLLSSTFILPQLTHLHLHEVLSSESVSRQTARRIIHLAEVRSISAVPGLRNLRASFSAKWGGCHEGICDERPLNLDVGDQARVVALSEEGLHLDLLWATLKNEMRTWFKEMGISGLESDDTHDGTSSRESDGSDSVEDDGVSADEV
ncbi:hypothetical protein VNI00_009032 [Paramarasmius palmivorus]|uniref:Cutinase n=1 Tax=Paramarasmius palmivorus TaxID=297713 RepID=A0AAW0CSE7_9AGAR